jgi:basic amino acid/polyamine antiporter, APA family
MYKIPKAVGDCERSGQAEGIGFGTCLALVMATMVGTGVYTSLGFQLQDLTSGFAILLIWAAGGIISLCGSLSYAELSSRIPASGGEYTYLTRAYHPAVGFMAGFVSLVAGFAAPIALAAIAFGTYLHAAFPLCPPKVAAVGAVILLSLGHLRSLEASALFQNIMTAVKFSLIAVFLLLGILAAIRHPSSLQVLAPKSASLHELFRPSAGVALLFVLYAYSGWNAPTYLAGEVRSGHLTVGRSLALGTLIVTLLYVLTNAVFLVSAPASVLRGKLDVGSIAAGYLMGATGALVMACLIAIGLLASLSAMILAGPRVTARIGEDHRIFSAFSRTDANGNPRRALLLQLVLVLLLILTGSFETVLIYAQIPLLLCLILGVTAVMVLRSRDPSFQGYLCPLYPFPPVLFILCTSAGLVYSAITKPWVAFAGLLTMMVPLVFHALISNSSTQAQQTTP